MKKFDSEESQKIMKQFKSIVSSRLDKLYDRFGPTADGELYAYSIAVNSQRRKQEKEPTIEEPMNSEKLKEMVIAALSEKKKSAAFTSQYDDKFDDKRKDLPDGLQKSILKKQGELDEVNLGHNEISSIYQEGGSWIVSYRTMDGKKEKVFQSEDEARKFASTLNEDLDLGHQDDEPHMIKAELAHIAKYAIELYKMVDQFEGEQEVDFPAWWQAKITTAKNMISSAKHYLQFELEEPKIDAMVGVASEEGVVDEGKLNKKEEKIVKGLKKSGFKKDDPEMYAIARSKAKDKIKEAILAKLKNK
jgi:hypothetical protein